MSLARLRWISPRRKHRSASMRSRRNAVGTDTAMSQAFVKEAEDKVEELPLVTHEGLMAIEAAHAGFEEAHREAITRNDAHAAAAAMREVRYWRARRAGGSGYGILRHNGYAPPRRRPRADLPHRERTRPVRRAGRCRTFRPSPGLS
jgi:hypothetical protein